MACQSFDEIIERHTNDKYIRLYSATNGNVEDVYFNRQTSVELFETFLEYQCSNNSVTIKSFLLYLYLLLSKQSGKRNCLHIYGLPDCGKTWFTQICAEFMINYGIISNFNRYSQFPFQDAISRNMLIFDEPNVEPQAFETFKLLFSGAQLSCNIKYEEYQVVQRTPVIVCTNRVIFPDNDEFNCRMYKITFHKYDFNHINKKNLPVAIYDLFIKYNIIMQQDME